MVFFYGHLLLGRKEAHSLRFWMASTSLKRMVIEFVCQVAGLMRVSRFCGPSPVATFEERAPA